MNGQSEADWQWVNGHFDQVANDLFPIKLRVGWYVGYRSHQDAYTATPEYSFIIGYEVHQRGYGLNPYLTAQVREADSVSVYDQMMKLHRESPNKPIADVQKALRVKAWTLTEKDCPAIKSQFEKLQTLTLTPPTFQVVILHSLVHEFRIRAGSADMDLTVLEQKNSYVEWALETRGVLRSCSTRNP